MIDSAKKSTMSILRLNRIKVSLLIAVLFAVFTVPLSVSGTAVALTDIASDLGNNPVGQQWALNGFNVTFAASTLVWGSLADRIGRWHSFLFGAFIFIVASLMSFLASSYLFLDAARILAGIGAGSIFSVGSALLSITFTGSERARVFSFMGAVAGLSLAFGPTLSGIVTQSLNWHYIFAIQGVLLIISSVFMLCCRKINRGEPKAEGKFDWPAAVFFFGLTSSLVSVLVFAPARGFLDPVVLILCAVSLLCLLLLILRERRVKNPLLNFHLISQARFLGVSLVVAVASFTFASFVTYTPSLIQVSLNFTPAGSGVFVMFMTVPTLIAPIVAGVIVARGFAPRTVLIASLAFMVVGATALSFIAGGAAFLLAPFMVLLGAGFGLHAGLVDNEGLAVVPDNDSGMAAGWINTMRVGTEAIAVSLFGSLFVPALAQGQAVTSFRTVGLISVAVALTIAIVSVISMGQGKKA